MVAQPSSPGLRFEVLGPVRGWRDGAELDLGAGKQRAVLAVLLLARSTPVPPSRIVEAVWGDEPPDNGTNVVQKYVAGLRRSLEPARAPRAPGLLLTLDDAGYTLVTGADQVDLDVFERLRRSGLRHRDEGRPGQALQTLRDAVAVVDEEPLAGLVGDWFAAARTRLLEERADALEACVELEVALGRHEQALPEIRALVERYPLRERLRGTLMLALHRSGRTAEALAAFQAAREDLVEALGVEPGPPLQDLHARLLKGDAALDGRPAPGAGPGPAPHTPVGTLPPRPSPSGGGPSRRHPLLSGLLAVGATVLVFVTLGLAGVLVTAASAAVARGRRQRVLSVATAVYLVLFVAGFALVGTATDDTDPQSVVGMVMLLVEACGASAMAVHTLFRRP